MEFLFLLAAVVGGAVLTYQFVTTLLGLSTDLAGLDLGGDGGDAHFFDHHDSSSWLFGVITFRTVIAALTFFGLAGMAARSGGFQPLPTLVIAVAAGIGALFGVHAIMRGFLKLRADGTMRIERSIGLPGTVCVAVPPRNSGAGKIQLKLQNRLVDLQAVTSAAARLPTGANIVVTEVLGPDLVLVEPLECEMAQPAAAEAAPSAS